MSLSTLNEQMSQTYIIKQQLPPMLELEMHLTGGKVIELLKTLYFSVTTLP